MTYVEPCSVKINLNLRVFRRRPDGYHELHTLFWRRPSPEVLVIDFDDRSDFRDDLTVYGAKIPGGNLVTRALEGLRAGDATMRALPSLKMELFKFFPMGSGVGAGSGNAAAFLRWARRLGVPVTAENCAVYGADVAFLASCANLAYAEGVGERLTVEDKKLEIPGVIIFPRWFSSTRDAYSRLDALREGKDVGAPAQAREQSRQLLDHLIAHQRVGLLPNDFLPIFFASRPEYATVFSRAESLGALGWGLCGSGSALFVLFSDTEALFSLQRSLAREEWIEKIWVME